MRPCIDHLLVPARDKRHAARWLADLLDLEVGDRATGAPPGRFAVVEVGGVKIGFHDAPHPTSHHLAFRVDDASFDAVLARVRDRSIPFWADPGLTRAGELNDYEGGRGFYVLDPSGNNWELLTRTIPST